ncbi:TetR/AcrR family transcriptional regulator [Yinghuangia soli]|uniref:TetR/AcrR family transcriptional regulator n=1 Tax=Yinghuangia soli TaxID=2908204 RepID=A0AA41Q6Q8_9ACTN|nr:TetR/AcrR family transcriptional regulator [Yinghuangia soli]MCF2531995.1 TetR/AcrR family transcriptional regulator [Yinghuangia soli]
MNSPLVPFGRPRGERADAARNREQLLETARAMLAEHGAAKVTMDALAERAGLGKGTVFRRFGTRAGIFQALLDDDERRFQQLVLSGPPPLGPGADPAARLIAYGRARTAFLLDHHAIARAALDRNQPVPAGDSLTRLHIRMLLGRLDLGLADLDSLAIQLTGALEGPLLLYLAMAESEERPVPVADHPLADAWQVLVERLTSGAGQAPKDTA